MAISHSNFILFMFHILEKSEVLFTIMYIRYEIDQTEEIQ